MTVSTAIPGSLDVSAASLSGDRSAEPPGTPMSFSGRAGEFFSMLVRRTLLLVPTFGFYRFWLITRLRRHLWANTRIGEDAFEYLGTAKEILIGFLLALAILTPVYLVYFLVGLYLEEQRAFASILLVVFLWALGHFAAYRGRRYRVNRTSFRGVRFWMDGSGLGYAGRAILWDILTVLTLFIALPWRLAALERYKMRHTHFGTLEGRFGATGMELFRRIWLLCLLSIPALLVGGFLGPFSFLVAITLGSVIYARIVSWRLGGVKLGEVALKGEVPVGAILKPYLWFLLATFLWSVVLLAVGAGVVFLAGGSVTSLMTGQLDFAAMTTIGIIALFYLVWLLGFGVLSRQILTRGTWENVVNASLVVNVGAFDAAVARAGPMGKGLDQGFADLLDAGGI